MKAALKESCVLAWRRDVCCNEGRAQPSKQPGLHDQESRLNLVRRISGRSLLETMEQQAIVALVCFEKHDEVSEVLQMASLLS
jgi:hypothetical protein